MLIPRSITRQQPISLCHARGIRGLHRALFACIGIVAGSCATERGGEAPPPPSETGVEAPSAPRPAPLIAQGEALAPGVDTREEIIERGTGTFIGAAPIRRGEAPEGDINLQFEATDIKEFVRAVLGDLLGVNYIMDASVAGTVTIQTSRPITSAELLPLFEEILAINGAALIGNADLYEVVPRAAAGGEAALSTSRPGAAAGYRTQIIPLRFIAAPEMRRILETVVPDPSALRTDTARNLIIVSGDAADVQAVQDTVNVFDVDWLRGMSIGLYPLDNVDPRTLEGELKEVLSAATGGQDDGILGGIVRLVPLERLTSLLVVSSTPAALREVELWIRRLDQPGESAGQRLYVYSVQNAKATELADILGAIFQSRASAGGADSGNGRDDAARDRSLAPGLAPVEIRPSGAPASPALGVSRSAGAVGPGDSSETNEGTAFFDSSTLEIIADDVRNALVILASPQEYRMVESAIRKLDVVPLQVLIEASILEVALRDDLSYGVEWFFRNNNVDAGTKTSTGVLDLGSAGITALAPGFSYTIVDSADQVRLALNLLATESDINVLSSPSLMVLDNQTATINVGDEIPVPARQSISNIDPSSPTVNEVTYRQTGVTLSVTPRVSSSGLVTMEIRQEVARAATTTTSDIDAPTIQNRQIDSVVAINSGETIVLGGLMQTQEAISESGIPGLRKIPGIGKLFGQTVDENARTELLVLITPRVVRSREDVRSITDEFRQKLPQLQRLEQQLDTAASTEPPRS